MSSERAPHKPESPSLRPLAQAEPRAELVAPLHAYVTAAGLKVALYALKLDTIPADFFADPDGSWTFESLQAAAGFSSLDGVAIGALKSPFNGHPDGAAVVTLNAATRPYVAIIECPIAFTALDESEDTSCSAA